MWLLGLLLGTVTYERTSTSVVSTPTFRPLNGERIAQARDVRVNDTTCTIYSSACASCDIVMYLHGGWFVTGDRHLISDLFVNLAMHNVFIVASVEYTLLRRNGDYARAIEDVRTIFAELRREYSTRRIFVAGLSAGGYLALDANVDADGYILESPVTCLSEFEEDVLQSEYNIAVQSNFHLPYSPTMMLATTEGYAACPKRVNAPTFTVHTRTDNIVPIAQQDHIDDENVVRCFTSRGSHIYPWGTCTIQLFGWLEDHFDIKTSFWKRMYTTLVSCTLSVYAHVVENSRILPRAWYCTLRSDGVINSWLRSTYCV